MIQEMPFNTIKILVQEQLSSFEQKKRKENKLEISDFLTDSSVKVDESLNYYGGLFNIPVHNDMLLGILIDKFMVDLDDTDRCKELLSSKHGRKIQRARFRDFYLKPLNKWLRNRSIINHDLGVSLMVHKVNGTFEDVSKYLDSVESYEPLDLLRFNVG